MAATLDSVKPVGSDITRRQSNLAGYLNGLLRQFPDGKSMNKFQEENVLHRREEAATIFLYGGGIPRQTRMEATVYGAGPGFPSHITIYGDAFAIYENEEQLTTLARLAGVRADGGMDGHGNSYMWLKERMKDWHESKSPFRLIYTLTAFAPALKILSYINTEWSNEGVRKEGESGL
ncbi:MAG: hypothetical protein HY518_02215 [Candidatus Aenigmarchaeota archaeon]|nr:hypothetical protein [Candidatus Aenigmarchaeota archaeon]